ncbi:MAG: Cation diffusion facilitator family transporter [Pedosphaera sp.]|nr:Cation diffusion facilitator family transporter [Pedosphaera sp.]
MNRLTRSLRATLLGMVVNTFFAAGKMAAGIFGHSHALMADAVESLADIFSSIVVWRALVVAEAPADEEHPYGHGKAEPIASVIVATMLLLAAVGIALNSIREILTPDRPGPQWFTLPVLVLVIFVKEGLYRFVAREAKSVDSTAVHADAWHHRSDAITSLAAAVGITISLIGGKGYEVADDVAAVVAAVIIAWNGWHLLRPSLNELMDAAPSTEVVDTIRRAAASIPGVQEVEKCMVRKTGHLYFVDMHVEVDPQMSVQQGHTIAHAVKDKVRETVPAVRDVLVHIEPGGHEKH